MDADLPMRVGGADFVDHDLQRLNQIGFLQVQRNTVAKSRPRQIHDVVDETVHPGNAGLHQIEDDRTAVRPALSQETARAGVDGGKRISEIVAQNRNELFPKLRQLALALQ